ncbi:MAG: trehalose-6-phosphate synthase [Candidatus Hydrothermarchaeota archaeon]
MLIEKDLPKKVFKVKKILENNKLTLVSNREPYEHEKSRGKLVCKRTLGGLVSALDPLMQVTNGLWVAWGSGNADWEVADSENKVRVPPEDPSYTLKRVWLSEEDINRYYHGFSNRVLWPVSHLFLENAIFDPKNWKKYNEVNEKFAEVILEENYDLIWIHDYHLSLVPRFLREAEEDVKIAFFWHIPWPPYEVFRTIPWSGEILEGLLNSDLIGFHTQDYVKNFIECVENILGAFVDRENGLIKILDRRICVKPFPLGIDYKRYNEPSFSKEILRKVSKLRKDIGDKKIILSFQRLDYSKGVVNKLLAFEKFLENNPEFHGRVKLILVASPSRTKIKEYREMKREIDEIIGRVNGKYQRIDWQPIKYFYRTIPQDQLISFYHTSDIALVTPVIDGMNLVSKEYIAANNGDGVLILSKFVGAADELKDAVLVNPYDIEEFAEAIKNALNMPLEERRRRIEAMREKVKEHDVYWWIRTFLEDWRRIYG